MALGAVGGRDGTRADPLGGARGADFVQSFDRGLSVIRAFREERRRLTLKEVAEETGLTPAAARRFLLTLVELGFVARDGREFSLRPRVLELGYATLSGLHLPALLRPCVADLVAKVDESGAVSVLSGTRLVALVRVPTRRMMTVVLPPGSWLPAYCTSAGRVLLAGLDGPALEAYAAEVALEARTDRTLTDPVAWRDELERVGRDGYAVVDQELEDGLIAMAVPIKDATGSVVASLNCSVDAYRSDRDDLEARLLGPLRETAAQLELIVRAVAPGGLAARHLPGLA